MRFSALVIVSLLAGCGLFEPSPKAGAVLRIPKARAGETAFRAAAEADGREWYRVSVTGPGQSPVEVTGEVTGASVRLDDLEPGTPRYFTAELFSDGAFQTKTFAGVSEGVTLQPGETAQVAVTVRPLVGNRPPSLTAATIADGIYLTDTPITVDVAGFVDLDGDPEQLRYTWLVNGVELLDVSGDTITGEYFAKGDVVKCRVTPFDFVTDGEPVESNEVVIGNSAPAPSVSFSPGTARAGTAITAIVTANDPDGDAYSLAGTWSVNAAPTGITAATLPTGYFAKGESVTYEVTVSDGELQGTASSMITIANSPPALASASLSTANPRETDVISVNTGATSDDDLDDTVTLTYQWYVNGVPVVGQTGPTLTGAHFNRGDSVYVMVTPTDGTAFGLPVVSNTATAVNSPPVGTSVGITPGTVRTNDYAFISLGTASDADGDSITWSYEWYVNGVMVSTLNYLWGGASFSKNDNLWVVAKPYDGAAYGVPLTSPTVTVANTPVSISFADIISPLYTNTTASVGIAYSDADGDSVSFIADWYVNSVYISTGGLLSGAFFDRGDAVTAAVRGFDGTEYGANVIASATVANSPPTAGVYTLTPGEVLAGTVNFTLSVNSLPFDGDFDTITYSVEWFKNGQLVSTDTGLSKSLSVAPRDVVHAVVRGYDGFEYGATAATNKVAVKQTARQVSLSASMGCAVTEGRDLECWGTGYYGDGNPSRRSSMMKVPAFAGDVTSVAVGSNFACALKIDGTLWCWGDNQNSRLGRGFVSVEETTPARVDTLFFKAVAAGDHHACAITDSDILTCWGRGDLGQHGLYTYGDSYTPTFVSTNVKQVSAKAAKSCAVTIAGTVLCWGSDPLPTYTLSVSSATLVSVGATAVKVAVSETHACVLTQTPDVRCWGRNDDGQLGDGTTVRPATPVTAALAGTPLDVAVGNGWSCALTTIGARCWGYNFGGSLGDSTFASTITPTVVDEPGVAGSPVTLEAAGASACAVYDDGALYCWGHSKRGVTGRGIVTKTSNADSVETLAAGDSAVCKTVAGDVWCWGKNTYGQFGTGAQGQNYVFEPMMASGGTSPAAAVALGNNHMCSLRDDGTVWCSGANPYGQVGTGGAGGEVLAAVQVAGLTASAIDLGFNTTCAVRATGAVVCWGDNFYGQAGIGTSGTNVLSPGTDAIGVANAVAVSAGYDHVCAVTSAGALYCWGRNNYGQLGDASYVDRPTPVQIYASGVLHVAAGYQGTCAVETDFDVWCWGFGSMGGIGDGNVSTGVSVPQRVAGGFTAKAIASNWTSFCAIDTADDVYCWGSNFSGELGIEGVDYAATPQGPLAQDVDKLAVGRSFACAFRTQTEPSGTLECWGPNDYGELLDFSAATPMPPLGYWPSNGL